MIPGAHFVTRAKTPGRDGACQSAAGRGLPERSGLGLPVERWLNTWFQHHVLKRWLNVQPAHSGGVGTKCSNTMLKRCWNTFGDLWQAQNCSKSLKIAQKWLARYRSPNTCDQHAFKQCANSMLGRCLNSVQTAGCGQVIEPKVFNHLTSVFNR